MVDRLTNGKTCRISLSARETHDAFSHYTPPRDIALVTANDPPTPPEQWSREERRMLLGRLKSHGLTFADCIAVFLRRRRVTPALDLHPTLAYDDSHASKTTRELVARSFTRRDTKHMT